MSGLLAFALDASMLFPFSIFGAVAAFAWLLLDRFSNKEGRAEERLAELRDPHSRRGGPKSGKHQGGMARMFENAAPALAKPLTPKNVKEADKLKMKLAHAGFRTEGATQLFLGIKLISLMTGLFLGGGFVLFSGTYDMYTFMKALFFAGIMFYVPGLGLAFLASKRKEKIFLGLPDALDLLVVCVEAGLGFDQAMRKVSEEMKKSHKVIADEFGLCNLQLQMGRARTEVLQDLGYRNGVDDLRQLASVLIQADKFGSSIAQALRTQSDAMRVRRRQIAEEKAAKTAVKLIFPLVIFIFPGIFVVLVGPAAITMVRELFPKMGG
jgi:tight adherence protein C